MKAWLERIWAWVKADYSATYESVEKKEQEVREQEERRREQREKEEQARLERRNRRGNTDGFRGAR